MAYHGINFRATSGYATDGSGETHSLGEAYPITRGGETFGFSIDMTGSARDRDNTLDRRLVGGVFRPNNAGVVKFFFDLPEGAGTYDVRLALGDVANPQNHRCLIRDGDGGTVLATINDDTGTPDVSWLDANGVERVGLPDGLPTPSTKWPLANTANQLAFTGTQMVLDLGDHSSGTNSTFIAHVSMDFISGGGGGSVAPRAFRIIHG